MPKRAPRSRSRRQSAASPAARPRPLRGNLRRVASRALGLAPSELPRPPPGPEGAPWEVREGGRTANGREAWHANHLRDAECCEQLREPHQFSGGSGGKEGSPVTTDLVVECHRRKEASSLLLHICLRLKSGAKDESSKCGESLTWFPPLWCGYLPRQPLAAAALAIHSDLVLLRREKGNQAGHD